MSETNRCERCGGPLSEDGPLGGTCPRCMLELGVQFAAGSSGDADSTQALEEFAPSPMRDVPTPTVVGRYRLLRLIGEGGMGAVYEAEQDQPRRIVALKIIKPGIVSPELLRRFEQESHALGRLQHPGIAQIYEAGTADTGFGPQPYFAMEFIRGKTFTGHAEEHRLNTRQRLEIVSKIAEAVQHAHQRGLIHRDLKPANILVDETGQPKILDFGVARATDSDTQATSETNIGQLLGTLAYMSPEQVLADPLELDTRSDVYALGVILFELLTGRMPYTISKKLHETIQAIREEDPARLSSINRSFRGDIETIVAKALEKDKTRRYGSAVELSADIQRYLKDQPIVARPPSARYQIWKFTRRHKALVAGVAAVFIVLVGGIVVSTSQMMRANRERDRANENQRTATQERAREAEQRHAAETARVQADAQTLVAEQALSTAEVNLYSNDINLAEREWTASSFDTSVHLLDEAPVRLRNWEWNYLERLNNMEEAVLAGHRDAVLALAIAPDGKRLRTFSADRTFKDWEIGTWKEVASGKFGASVPDKILRVVLSANGRLLYAQTGGPASTNGRGHYFWDLPTGKDVFSFPPEFLISGTSAMVTAVTLSPDGLRVAAASQVRVTPTGTTQVVTHSILRTWDIKSGVNLDTHEYANAISGLVFSPDGTMLAVIQAASTKIVSAITGKELVTLGNSRGITTLVFSRDGATVVAGVRNEGVRAWKSLDGKERWSFSSTSAPINELTFDPGGGLLATALDDGTLRILDSATGNEDTRLVGTANIQAFSFTPDGTHIVSVGNDKLVRVWRVRTLAPDRVFDAGRTGPVSSLRVHPDGHTFIIGTGSGLKSWDSNTGQSGFERSFKNPIAGAGPLEVEFTQNGTRVALMKTTRSSRNPPVFRHDLYVMDAQSGREIAAIDPLLIESAETRVPSNNLRISPNGNRLAFVLNLPTIRGRLQPRVHIWNIANGKLLTGFNLDAVQVQSLDFSPNGRRLAMSIFSISPNGTPSRRLEIYDSATGRLLSKLDGPEDVTLVTARFAFSQDGNRLAWATGNGSDITIWDAQTGLKLASLPDATDTIESMAFSPDGTRLVSVASNGDVQLWDASSGKKLIHLRDSTGHYAIREVTVIDELGAQQAAAQPDNARLRILENSISFSADGRKITLTTVTPDPKGVKVRIATWDGTPLHEAH